MVPLSQRSENDESLVLHNDYHFCALSVDDDKLIADQRDKIFLEMGMEEAQVAKARQFYMPWLEQSLANGVYKGYAVVHSETNSIVAGAAIWTSIGGPFGKVMSHDLRRATLTNVYVETGHRRKGIARALVQRLIKLAKQEGYPCLNLHASDAGRPLYESFGFEDTHEYRLILTPP